VLLACLVGAAQLAACGGADRPSGDDVRDAQKSATQPLYWAGETAAGLPLTGITRAAGVVTFGYGDCNLPEGEGGCPVPVSVQTASICNVKALFLDVRPTAGRRVRGITARVRGPGTIDLATGTSNITVRADRPARLERVLAALRPVEGGGARGELPQPRYPLSYIEQLRRARDAFVQTGSVRGARDKLGISQRAIRFRLRLADKLGKARLRRPANEFAGQPCPVEPAR
jgi:hypothetical protein